jgi:hypothetical protein
MKYVTVKLEEGDKAFHLYANVWRNDKGKFVVGIAGMGIRGKEPLWLELGEIVDSWYKAVDDTRSRLYLMRACLQYKAGKKVVLPVYMMGFIEKIPNLVTEMEITQKRQNQRN